jgi:hypothetical protein
MLPVLAPLLPHLRTRLSTAWAAFLSTRGEAVADTAGPSMENAQAADVEVIAERQMRELTQETLSLLEALKGDPVKGEELPKLVGVCPLLRGKCARSLKKP